MYTIISYIYCRIGFENNPSIRRSEFKIKQYDSGVIHIVLGATYPWSRLLQPIERDRLETCIVWPHTPKRDRYSKIPFCPV